VASAAGALAAVTTVSEPAESTAACAPNAPRRPGHACGHLTPAMGEPTLYQSLHGSVRFLMGPLGSAVAFTPRRESYESSDRPCGGCPEFRDH